MNNSTNLNTHRQARRITLRDIRARHQPYAGLSIEADLAMQRLADSMNQDDRAPVMSGAVYSSYLVAMGSLSLHA